MNLKIILAVTILYLTAKSSLMSCDGLELKDLDKDIAKTVVVDHNGAADFKTIQAAIDSVPNGNNNWIKIILTPGTYDEKIVIPKDKQKIIMEGKINESSEVIVQYNDAEDNTWSGPLIVYAEYFVAINIIFKNTYNKRTPIIPKQEVKKAPAVVLLADKVVFSRCRFISVQDTIADMVGRHYFQNCYIEGAIDFIWGRGQSIYQNCIIYVRKVVTPEGKTIPGYITAQGRENKQDTNGFVFISCVIKGDGEAYLGRAYREYSRVIFYETEMSNVVVPQGWDPWNYTGNEDKITYVEIRCKGEGANKEGRVKWEKELSDEEVNLLIQPQSFIDEDNWMPSFNPTTTTPTTPVTIYYYSSSNFNHPNSYFFIIIFGMYLFKNLYLLLLV